MTVIATGWAVQSGSGVVVTALWPNATELEAWQTFVGWPDPEAIADVKALGARAFRCEIREIEE